MPKRAYFAGAFPGCGPKRREFTSYLHALKTRNFLAEWPAFTHFSDQKITFQGQSCPAWTTSRVRISRFSMPRVVNLGLYDPAAAPEHVDSELTSLAAAPEHLNSQLFNPAAATMYVNPQLYGPAAPPEYANSQLYGPAAATEYVNSQLYGPAAATEHVNSQLYGPAAAPEYVNLSFMAQLPHRVCKFSSSGVSF